MLGVIIWGLGARRTLRPAARTGPSLARALARRWPSSPPSQLYRLSGCASASSHWCEVQGASADVSGDAWAAVASHFRIPPTNHIEKTLLLQSAGHFISVSCASLVVLTKAQHSHGRKAHRSTNHACHYFRIMHEDVVFSQNNTSEVRKSFKASYKNLTLARAGHFS